MLVSKKIDSCISNKRPQYFNELFDENAFVRKISKETDTKNTRDIIKGVKEALSKTDLGDKIIKGLGESGHYQFVKHYEKDKVQHLIFRLYSDDGINYHDFEISKTKGKLGIADMYIYLSGENLSKTISGLMATFSEKPKSEEPKALKEINAVNRIREYMSQKENEKAMNLYNSLSPDIKDQRAVQLIYIQLCQLQGEEQYMKAMDDFQTRYPNDPNVNLLMIDNYLLKKEFGKALDAINKLDSYIDSDPFLDYYRALISNMNQKPDDARKYLEKLHTNMPQFGDGVVELIANYITAGDNDKARVLVKEYEANSKFDQARLSNYLYLQPQFSKE